MEQKNMREGNPQIFQVEKILQRGKSGDQVYYLVKWKGYSESECTWEPQTNLEGCKQAILEFEERLKLYQIHQTRSPKKQIHSRDTKDKLSLQCPNKSRQKSSKNRTKKLKSMNDPKLGLESSPSKESQNIHPSKTLEQQASSNSKAQQVENKYKIQLQKGKDGSIFQEQRKQEKIIESESENESLEATTAQTIPPKVNQIPSNVSSELRRPFKASTIQSEISKLVSNGQKNSVESENVLNSKSENTDSSTKQKNIPISTRIKRQNPLENSAIDQKNESIRKKIKQETILKPQNNAEKQPDQNLFDRQLEKCIVSSVHKEISKQKLQSHDPTFGKSVNEKSQLQQNQSVAKEKKTAKDKSRRYLLCQQYLQDLKTQIIEDLCIFDSNSDQTKNQPSRQILLTRFINLTDLNAKCLNQKLLKKVLAKTQVDRLDKEGDFLDSKIQMLLKVKCEDHDTPREQWICVIEKKSLDENQQELVSSKHLVNVDDLKEDVWRKMFRKLTLCHQN